MSCFQYYFMLLLIICVLPAKWFRFCTRDICNFECDSSIYRYINDIISFMGCTVISFVCVYHLDWTDLRAKNRDRNSERERVCWLDLFCMFLCGYVKQMILFWIDLNWIDSLLNGPLLLWCCTENFQSIEKISTKKNHIHTYTDIQLTNWRNSNATHKARNGNGDADSKEPLTANFTNVRWNALMWWISTNYLLHWDHIFA